MRVMHLVKTTRGAAWAVKQVRELVSLGIDVHVVVPDDGPRRSEYERVGATCHELVLDLPEVVRGRRPQVLRAFRRMVGDVQPDILHSHFVGTTITARLALGRDHPLPRLFQVPGPLHLEHPAIGRAEVATAGRPDRWIGSCWYTVACYRQLRVDPARLFCSYYGTDIEAFPGHGAGAIKAELARRGLGGAAVIGMVAYFYRPRRSFGAQRGVKGHEDLIDALALLLREGHDVAGVFIGGPWGGADAYACRVRRRARDRCGERAVFLGARSDVPDLYPEMTLAAVPSLSENLGGAAEAMLSGVPTVATSAGGLPELVVPGETGFRSRPSDPVGLAAALSQALAQPAEERTAIAQAGRRHARRQLDVRATARQVRHIYAQVTGA